MTIWIIMGWTLIVLFLILWNRNVSKYNTSFDEYIRIMGLPLVCFTVGKQGFYFVLDSGSTHSHIDDAVLNTIGNDCKEKTLYHAPVMGIEGNVVDTCVYKVKLTLNNKHYTENFCATNLSNAFAPLETKYGVKISGLLGTSFFLKYGCKLNFKQNVLQ